MNVLNIQKKNHITFYDFKDAVWGTKEWQKIKKIFDYINQSYKYIQIVT